MARAANTPLDAPDAQESVFKYNTSDAKPDGKTGIPVEIVVYWESTPLDMHLSTTAPPLNFDSLSLRTVQSLSEYRTVPKTIEVPLGDSLETTTFCHSEIGATP